MKNVIAKEWIGKRKIRIYLLWNNKYYKFCWLQLLIDGSFSFGFESKTLRFTEYGSAVVRSGTFAEHVQILSGGNVIKQGTITPHVTFHSPRINQYKGIVNFTSSNGRIDRWGLDWFPVKYPQLLLCAYSGDISKLEKAIKLKERHEIASLPSNIQCVRMELIILPIPKLPVQIHDINALANIHGFCPNYILNCRFYENTLVEPCLYMATDTYIPKN